MHAVPLYTIWNVYREIYHNFKCGTRETVGDRTLPCLKSCTV